MPCAKLLAVPEGSSASVAKVMTGMAWLLCDRLRYRERRSEAGPLLNLLCLSGFRGAARDAARTTWIAVEHVNRGSNFDAHGDRSAPRTDQARNKLIIAPNSESREPFRIAIAFAYRRAALRRAAVSSATAAVTCRHQEEQCSGSHRRRCHRQSLPS